MTDASDMYVIDLLVWYAFRSPSKQEFGNLFQETKVSFQGRQDEGIRPGIGHHRAGGWVWS